MDVMEINLFSVPTKWAGQGYDSQQKPDEFPLVSSFALGHLSLRHTVLHVNTHLTRASVRGAVRPAE